MTPEQINKAIAEFEGWKLRSHGGWSRNGDLLNIVKNPPDYFNDLNAVHRAIEKLSLFDRIGWPMELRKIILRDNGGREHPDIGKLDDTHFYNATAPQRCQALLRTIGKWEEGKGRDC